MTPTRRAVLAIPVIAAALVVGCSSDTTTAAPTPASETTTTTTTTTTAVALGQFYDEWNARFDALPEPQPQPCPPERVRSEACADYLAPIVAATLELEKAIRARPDSDQYAGTLAEVEKITQAGDRYAQCYDGGGTVNHCHAQAIAIGIGSRTLLVRLYAEDLKS